MASLNDLLCRFSARLKLIVFDLFRLSVCYRVDRDDLSYFTLFWHPLRAV